MSNPEANCLTSCAKCTCSSTSHNSESRNELNGSKLTRSVPVNKTGSCGIIDMCDRKTCSPRFSMSNPSIRIDPVGSAMRKRAEIKELFPKSYII